MSQRILVFLLFGVLCYFPLFFHLDQLPLKLYDEARLAVNAADVLEGGDWLVTQFNGEPDMWNTKPPLMIWLQAICLQVFGYHFWSIRLPAALAALLTVFLLLYYFIRYHQRPILAYFSAFLLITTPGYICEHVSRTGDYDALVILFLTSQVLFFARYLQAVGPTGQRKYMWLCTLSITLAVMTKGIIGLVFLPALLFFVLIQKKIWPLLMNKHTWLGIGFFLMVVVSYYLGREQVNPGYIQAVLNNEVTGRYLTVLEKNSAAADFYIRHLWNSHFTYWLFFLPLGIVLFIKKRKDAVFPLLQLVVITIVFYLLIISFAQTKLEWYDAPLFPLLSILVAFGLEQFYLWLRQYWRWKPQWLLLLFTLCIFTYPYQAIVQQVAYPVDTNGKRGQYAGFMKTLESLDTYTIAYLYPSAQMIFCEKMYTQKGYKINYKEPRFVAIGDRIVICEAEVKAKIDKRLTYQILQEWKACLLVEIVAER